MVLIKQPLSMGVVVCILVTLLSACSNTLQSTSHSATPNQNKSSVDQIIPYKAILMQPLKIWVDCCLIQL